MLEVFTINTHIKQYIQYLRLELGLADNTVIAYKADVDAFNLFFGQPLTSASSTDIVSFMAFMRRGGLSIETILRRLSAISQFYDFLLIEKLVTKNPVEFIAKPKGWKKLPSFLEFEEVDAILQSADKSTPKGYRDALIVEMLYASGMRVSELVNMKVRDIDFKRGIIKVTGKGSKERIVPIYSDLVQSIEGYLVIRQEYFVKQSDTGYLFLNRMGEPLTRQYIWSWVKNICTHAGIKKHVSPHTLRHCFATHILSGGADLRTIQLFLGHANISTTEIYTHVTDSDKRKVITNFHPRYGRR